MITSHGSRFKKVEWTVTLEDRDGDLYHVLVNVKKAPEFEALKICGFNPAATPPQAWMRELQAGKWSDSRLTDPPKDGRKILWADAYHYRMMGGPPVNPSI